MKQCMVCGEPLGKPQLRLENAPSCAQDLPGPGDRDADSGMDLEFYACPVCGLVQLGNEPVPYFRDVIRAGGLSDTMRRVRWEQYARLIEDYHLEGKRFLEVGCGQGEFLDVLREFPVECCGIEHRASLAELAREKGLRVWQDFPETPEQEISGGPYDVFLCFNFLEHQPRPNDLLRCIRKNLKPGGLGLVTVPSLDYVLEKYAFYELMRDHLAYYTEDSLRFLMEHNGFQVLEQEIVNGDTLAVTVRRREETDLSGFRANLEELRRTLAEYGAECAETGRKIAVWGASHQAFAVLSILGFGKHVSYVIDSAAFKQGKLAPASHVPIVGPEHFFMEPVEDILIIAPGYAREIAKAAKDRFGSDIRVIALSGAALSPM